MKPSIQYKQITLYIELLQNNGTYLPENITKHIEDKIWGKKTKKTPRREIKKAKSKRDDYMKRKEN